MTGRSRLTPRAKGTHAPPSRFAWAQVAVACAFLVLVGALVKSPPAPALPEEVVRKTLAKYREVRDRLLG